jgi:hypothetical protein
LAAVAAHRRDWRAQLAGRVADLAGKLTGRALKIAPTVPGLAGAAGFSVCLGGFAGHVFGHGLTPWVAGLAGSGFALLLDRRIP